MVFLAVSLVFFDFDDLGHLESFLFELFYQFVHLLDLWIAGVESVDVVGKLIGFVSETLHTDHRILGDRAFCMIGMSAPEVNCLFPLSQRETAGPAIRISIKAMYLLEVIFFQHSLQAQLDQVGSNVVDVDAVG